MSENTHLPPYFSDLILNHKASSKRRVKKKLEINPIVPSRRDSPRIITTRYFPQQPNVRIHNFQCNCACAEDGFNFETTPINLDQSLRAAKAHTQPLPEQHHLIFNPIHASGVAVLNDAAEQLRQAFINPRHWQTLDFDQDKDRQRQIIQHMCEAGVLEQADASPIPRRSPPKVLSTWIHVTNECNLRCDYCYIRKTDDDMDEATGRAAVDAIFRSAQKHGFERIKLKFAGGEATMNLKRVFDIHAYAQQKAAEHKIAVDTVVLSNGVSIGAKAIQAFSDHGIQISISLDGIGEAHDAQRKFVNGMGSFAWVDRTIQKLIARGVNPFISITLSARNAKNLPETVRYCAERDLPFNINFFRDNDCATAFNDLRYNDDQMIEAMRAAFAVLEQHMLHRSLLGTLVDRAQFDQPHDKTCSVGDSYIVVDHKGNIAKCQMEIERNVGDIWAEDPLGLIRADQIGIRNISVDEKEGCRDCEWKYWCAGGCPALTFRATGRFDVKSPNCRIYKAIYPEMLKLEGLRLLKLAKLSGMDEYAN